MRFIRKAAVTVAAAGALALVAGPAVGAECVPTEGRDAVEAVYETRTIDDAYTETIEHPEVTETVVVEDAWVETVEHPEVTEVRVVTPAYTETIEHDAVTEQRVVTEAWVETIDHPAIVEYVDHDATYATEHLYKKQVKTVRTKGNKTEVVHDWQWWSPVSAKWSEQDVAVLESGDHANWKEQGWNYDRDYRYVKTGDTRQGRMVTPPWTEERVIEAAWVETIEHDAVYETVVVTPAWTETIEHDAVTEVVVVTAAWTETIEHPAVVETRIVTHAWTEVIEHPAVVETVLVSEAVPAVDPVVCAPDGPELAETGVDPWALAALAAVLVMAGGALVALRRRAG